jgi:uncharacterized protein (TIGR03118 family)
LEPLLISSGSNTAPALFLFASENGTLYGWNDAVDPNHGVPIFIDKTAVFKGIAVTMARGAPVVYATDFHNGRVDTFDGAFHALPASFVDPNLPAGYAPFGIEAINGTIFVTFAKQDDAQHDDVQGIGLGIVDAFDVDGNFLARIDTAGRLNAPWGMAMAPASWGSLSGMLLVGNFGDGRITAIDTAARAEIGYLNDANGNALVVDGLWGITFGNGTGAGDVNTLYVAAGPGGEQHGLFAKIALR